MAVASAALTSGSSEVDGTSFATASVTPTADRLVLLAVAHQRDGSADPSALSSVTGNGLTWVQVATVLYDTAGASHGRLSLWRTLGASPSAGAITMNAPETQIGAVWSVVEFSGADTTGTNGSGAIVQSVTNLGSAVTSLTVTLAAFGSVDNATYGTFGANSALSTWTVGSGFTQLHVVANAAEGPSLLSEFRVDNDTSVDATRPGGASGDVGGIAVEIQAAVAAPEGVPIAWYVG
jgi:hypothetical protein